MRLLPVVVLVSAFLAPAYGTSHAALPCTLGMEPSVLVKVVDAGGNPQPQANVTFTLDGGPLEEQGCHRVFGPWPGTGCQEWYGGLEQLGMFTVTALGAGGTSATANVPVTVMGRCHVETQSVTLVLQ